MAKEQERKIRARNHQLRTGVTAMADKLAPGVYEGLTADETQEVLTMAKRLLAGQDA